MTKEIKELDPIVSKVLTLQIHKVPIISLSEILGLSVAEVDKTMRDNGYVFEDGIYKIPLPKEPEPNKKVTTKTVKKKKKTTSKQKLDVENDINPYRRLERKYGEYNFETKLFHLNVEVVKVLVMQDDEKLPLEKIAEKMNMTVKVLTNFMKKHNYILQEEPEVRKTKKKKDPRLIFVKTKPIKEEKINPEDMIEIIDIPLTRIDETNEVVEAEIGFSEDDLVCFKKMYNWYLRVKDLPACKVVNE